MEEDVKLDALDEYRRGDVRSYRVELSGGELCPGYITSPLVQATVNTLVLRVLLRSRSAIPVY